MTHSMIQKFTFSQKLEMDGSLMEMIY